MTWGAQFPIAGRALSRIDPFYFTLLRYLAVSLILVVLLIVSEGTQALSFEGKATRVWFFGTMAFTVYNFLGAVITIAALASNNLYQRRGARNESPMRAPPAPAGSATAKPGRSP